MTEAEWLASDDPAQMCRAFVETFPRRVAALYGAACVRATPEAGDQALLLGAAAAVEEAGVTGTWAVVDRLHSDCLEACRRAVLNSEQHLWALAGLRLTHHATPRWGAHVPLFLEQAVGARDELAAGRNRRAYAGLLRDVAGCPLPGGHGRRWGQRLSEGCVIPVVRALAEGAYETGDFSSLPILADALEEAGCADAGLLAHLRGAGPHVRGCWALDLILGRG